MKVYNADKTDILLAYDLEQGYLVDDTIIHHIAAVEGIAKQSHYEIIKEYPNGGKDVKEVIDVEEVLPVEEHEEIESIQVYIPYTEEELERLNNQKLVNEYEQWFNDYFDKQLNQHLWQIDYVPSFDNYFNCEYVSWEDVCEKANFIRAEIKRLRNLLR